LRLGRGPDLRAVGAQPGNDQLGPLGSEPRGLGGPQEWSCLNVTVEVLDSAAAAADGVLVGSRTRVVQSRAQPGPDAPGKSELHEQLERRVHGGSRGSGQHVTDRPPDLVGRGVAAPTAKLAEDDVALRRRPLAAAVQKLGELQRTVGKLSPWRIDVGDGRGGEHF
jgi:hypothetical protein